MPWFSPSSSWWRARLGWSVLSRPKDWSASPSAVAAWAEFYVDEERSGEPRSLEAFAAMLCRHGCPDLGNPLASDSEAYFLIHPGGFLAGEFDRCLRQADTELDERRAAAAMGRLGLLAHLNCPMLSAKAYWAEDDLRFAMALSAFEGRWERVGGRASRVVVNALRSGLIEPMAAAGILIGRRLADEDRWPSPWRRLMAALFPPKPPEPIPEPPAIDMASWREARKRPPEQLPPDPLDCAS